MARAFRAYASVTGIRELVNMMDTMIDNSIDILEDATKQATEIVHAKAEQNVKKVTGDMHAAIDIRLQKSRKDTKKVWQVHCKDPGAASLESGNSKMEPQPFLRKALDSIKYAIQDKINEVILNRLGI